MFDNSTIYIFCVVSSVVLGFIGWLVIRLSERKTHNDVDHTPYTDFEDAKPRDYERDSEF